MIFAIFDSITFNISKILEWSFDELEYRLALRAFRHATRAKTKEHSRIMLLKRSPQHNSKPVSANAASTF
jgi:hypothetical protein